MLLSMKPRLILPPDFSEYAWEVEFKGCFFGASVQIGDESFPVSFYDPSRLAQEIAEDISNGRPFMATRIIVVERVSTEEMTLAINELPSSFHDQLGHPSVDGESQD